MISLGVNLSFTLSAEILSSIHTLLELSHQKVISGPYFCFLIENKNKLKSIMLFIICVKCLKLTEEHVEEVEAPLRNWWGPCRRPERVAGSPWWHWLMFCRDRYEDWRSDTEMPFSRRPDRRFECTKRPSWKSTLLSGPPSSSAVSAFFSNS